VAAKTILRSCVGLFVASLALVSAGCGGSSSSSSSSQPGQSSPTTTTSKSGTQSAALKSFQACLTAHGVKGALPGGQGQQPPPSGNGKRPTFNASQQKAFTACSSKLPAGAGALPAGIGSGGRVSAKLKRYTTCLKAHGVTLGANNNQKAFKTASKTCAKYAPTASTTP
jgi:hypothetical protein